MVVLRSRQDRYIRFYLRSSFASRLFRRLGVLFLCLLSTAPLAAQEAGTPSAEELETLTGFIREEDRAELFSYKIGDSDVSLDVSGFWKGSLSLNWGLSHSNLGFEAVSPDSPLLFTQEADITLSLWIRDRWFLEASFLDDYDVNTYRAGYQGLDGETIQYVGIGNTGLDFPVFPYLDLGGDAPGNFGVYGRFGSSELAVHSLLRLDMAAREERVWVGNRERTFENVPAQGNQRGRWFTLPSENISGSIDVYIEDRNGAYSGGDGRRYRAALPSEYAASSHYGIVELKSEASGRVAVVYGPATAASYDADMGTGFYSVASGFLGKVQAAFNQNPPPVISLADYPQPGQDDHALLKTAANRPGTITLNGTNALVIYEPGTFSPFEGRNRYTAPSSASEDAALIYPSSGSHYQGYSLYTLRDSGIPELSIEAPSAASRQVYELLKDGKAGYRDAERRWPLADMYPEIYLPGHSQPARDLAVRFTNYGSSSSLVLGSDVVPGSIHVYREGLEDPRFSFDERNGTISLETPPGFNELVRVSYLKRSDMTRDGSLAAGLGAVWTPGEKFRTAAALGLRWNLNASGDAYSEAGVSNPGTVGFSSLASWEDEHFRTKLTLGLGMEQPDTTGLYRVAGMEGAQLEWPYNSRDSFTSLAPSLTAAVTAIQTSIPGTPAFTLANRALLVYRNYRETGPLGGSSLKSISSSAPVVSSMEGPYPARDDGSDTVILAAEFSLDPGQIWTGFETPLQGLGANLENAGSVTVPLRLYGFSFPLPPSLRILVQFGPLRDKDNFSGENPSLIVEQLVYDSSSADPGLSAITTSLQSGNWVHIALNLSPEDREKIGAANYMRILIAHDGLSSLDGRVLAGPLMVRGSTLRPMGVTTSGEVISVFSSGKVSAMEVPDTTLRTAFRDEIDRFHPGSASQRVLKVDYEGISAGEGAGVDGRYSAIPFADYEKLVFYYKAPVVTGTVLHVAAGPGPEALKDSSSLYLDAEIPGNLFSSDQWHRVEIKYGGGAQGVSVNGAAAPSASVHYRPPRSDPAESDESAGRTMYMAVYLIPAGGTGSFSIDEIALEDSKPYYRGNLGLSASWSRDGAVLVMGERTIVSNLSAETALESSVRGRPDSAGPELKAALQSRSSTKFTLLGARLGGELRLLVGEEQHLWQAGHSVEKSFGPLALRESFNSGPADKRLRHEFSLGYVDRLRTQAASVIDYQNQDLLRNWSLGTGYQFLNDRSLRVDADIDWQWRERDGEPEDWLNNYGTGWTESVFLMKPDSGQGIRARRTHGVFTGSLTKNPVGLSLGAEGASDFNLVQAIATEDSRGRLEFPFRFGTVQGNTGFRRSFYRSLDYMGISGSLGIEDDLANYAESLAVSAPL
ncbi:MAG: hypothetical protein LBI85_07755, partial [Spirochaetaceae bacterium]|nr:hypothetical protein [Spirochaetaceae bacterium]